jgi:hypothetical protein
MNMSKTTTTATTGAAATLGSKRRRVALRAAGAPPPPALVERCIKLGEQSPILLKLSATVRRRVRRLGD